LSAISRVRHQLLACPAGTAHPYADRHAFLFSRFLCFFAANSYSTLDPRPSTLDPRPSTLDPRPSTLDPRPSTLDPRPSTLDPRPPCHKKAQNSQKEAREESPASSAISQGPGATSRYHLSRRSPVVFPNWRDLITAYLLQTSFQFFAKITENLHHAKSQAFLVAASTIYSFQETFNPKPAPENKLQEKFNSICLVESVTLTLDNLKDPMKIPFFSVLANDSKWFFTEFHG
jgi:hypothetical protein